MENIALYAISAALNGQKVFCKFLAANDTGLTGGHQEGIILQNQPFPFYLKLRVSVDRIRIGGLK